MSIPSVVQVYAKLDYTIIVYFDDGRIIRRDIKPLVDKGGVFEALRHLDFFLNHVTVLDGTVAWSRDYDPAHSLDLDPLVLYEQGEAVTDQE